ncbi:MAG: LytTR family DNA-binding domain-containing protein [Bryobacteraceae bacterium]|nr:LytTR family DNA-binding domain-containing protein [Bryobacteraceae bacterium]
MIRAYLVDDEPLATRRLARMLEETGKVQVVGMSHDPAEALTRMPDLDYDVVFLDVEMPEINGFELLARLDGEPLVVFVTAFNQYALRAFEVNSIDYLVKPVEREMLHRAIRKLERRQGEARPPLADLVRQVTAAIASSPASTYPERLASRVGDKVEFVDLSRVTHLYAEDKLTFAATDGKRHIVDLTIAELETKLDPRRFVRIHRSTLVNVAYVQELYNYFAGKMLLRLKDGPKTELAVARERVKELKERLGI